MNAYDWHADVRARIEAHLADGQNPCSTSDDVVLRLLAECDVERARAERLTGVLRLVRDFDADLCDWDDITEAIRSTCIEVGLEPADEIRKRQEAT